MTWNIEYLAPTIGICIGVFLYIMFNLLINWKR